MGVKIMDINKILEENKLIINLEGRLDTDTAPGLEKELNKCLPRIKNLIFDFENLIYISSAGLRVILQTQKIMDKRGFMMIVNVNDFIMEVFEATGFVDILNIK